MTAPDMGSYEFAMQFKELIADLVTAELERQRPTPIYATVQSINVPERSCMVIINGDTTAVKAYCASIIPSAVGQVVRLEGTPGDRYIADVQGANAIEARTAALESTVNWTAPTLATGITPHSVDPVKYRVITEHGYQKVQLRGRVEISGTRTLLWTMPTGARPLVTLAPILVARSTTQGAVAAQIDVLASGAINLVAQTIGSPGGGTTSSVDPNDNTTGVVNPYGGTSGGGDPQTSGPTIIVNSGDTAHKHLFNHTHGITGSHSHTNPSVTEPTFVSFNGIEYFL